MLKTRGSAIALAAVVSHGSKYLFRLIAASRERRPIFPFLQLSAFRHNGHDFSEGELSAGVRKSETVTLRDPVMPVTDGFSG